jgi:hypothetical protein
MTKDEALKMAIEALNTLRIEKGSIYQQAISACKEALEQPAQEPVEVYGILDDGDYVSVEATKKGAIKQCEFMNKHDCNCTYKPLYTHPHQWQGLTDDEISQLFVGHTAIDFARAIEQALKDKNHG